MFRHQLFRAVPQESDREVTTEEGQNFGKAHGCLFVETSAKADVAVTQAFEELVLKVPTPPTAQKIHMLSLESDTACIPFATGKIICPQWLWRSSASAESWVQSREDSTDAFLQIDAGAGDTTAAHGRRQRTSAHRRWRESERRWLLQLTQSGCERGRSVQCCTHCTYSCNFYAGFSAAEQEALWPCAHAGCSVHYVWRCIVSVVERWSSREGAELPWRYEDGCLIT